MENPAVADASVVGVPSKEWGETPVSFVCLTEPGAAAPAEILATANAQLGKMQRLSDIRVIDTLPRSAIGKVLKRELQEVYAAG